MYLNERCKLTLMRIELDIPMYLYTRPIVGGGFVALT